MKVRWEVVEFGWWCGTSRRLLAHKHDCSHGAASLVRARVQAKVLAKRINRGSKGK